MIRLRPHRLLADGAALRARSRGPPVIGVLGNIGSPKGAAVLAALSRRLAEEGTARSGAGRQSRSRPSRWPRGRAFTARYRREDIPALVARYGIDRWLIPSVWPETFSYTTHEALATGLPVWCFDLGAQGEAVRAATHATRPWRHDPAARRRARYRGAAGAASRPGTRRSPSRCPRDDPNAVHRRSARDRASRCCAAPDKARRSSCPQHCVIEAPASLKWTQFGHSLELGAFSYQVSGFCTAARIGRYCSFGEEVQIGRQNHPMTWASTSPAFYLHGSTFDLGDGFEGAGAWQRLSPSPPPSRRRGCR